MEGAWCQHPSWLYRRTGMQGGALPRLEPVGEGPFAYPLRACVFSLPAFELPLTPPCHLRAGFFLPAANNAAESHC